MWFRNGKANVAASSRRCGARLRRSDASPTLGAMCPEFEQTRKSVNRCPQNSDFENLQMRPAPADSCVLVDDLVARLEQLIVTGTLKPGEKLIEQALSARFGIS